MEQAITHQRLLTVLSYNKESGDFTWNIAPASAAKKGQKAGSRLAKDYWQIGVDGRDYPAHRLAWFYVHGVWPSNEIDHINRKKNDNRFCNLREATRSQNHQNRDLYSNNTSGFSGVGWHERDQKWRVKLKVNGRVKHVGAFEDKELAALVSIEARVKYHPFYVLVVVQP